MSCISGFRLAGNECAALETSSTLPAHCLSLNSSRGCGSCQQGITQNNLGYNLKNGQCILASLVCNLT